MDQARVHIHLAAELWLFVAPRHRREHVEVPHDGTSSLGHVIESLGVPLPEIGDLLVSGRAVPPSYRPASGDEVTVRAPRRPQELPVTPPAFLLDVHLGTLARRLRLLGLDTAYSNDRDDEELVVQANAERRVLLTQDRGLLCRRKLWLGAYVRGARPDDQLHDFLQRFAPPLAPWTRCTSCNGRLSMAGKEDVEHLLRPGTRRSYDVYGQCDTCGHVYWRGAHSRRLEDIVERATRTVAAYRYIAEYRKDRTS
ncbi:MAG TPA: Mut7-C RNAse domain-containing protein [Actinomadura sp.]|jgi:uncharacterized protein with PIN domain|nr:Mut7-C RNAse domain-containing protein [Actinomadura sp.]